MFSMRDGIRKKGRDYILMIDANLGVFSLRLLALNSERSFRIRGFTTGFS